MSALDEAVEFFNPGPRARMCGDGARADAYEAARAELSALRERLADAEMIARAAFPPDDEDAPYMTYGAACDEDGTTVYYAHRNAEDDEPVVIDDDGTGLPLLTPEARARLRGEAAP